MYTHCERIRKMSNYHTKMLIIGSGPAGYTAAIYGTRANLSPIQVIGIQPGGQLTVTTDVENYPGFADVIQGPWLMEQMNQQAINVGTQIIEDMITKVDFSKRPFNCWTDSNDHITADTVIIATGAQARWLEIESEHKFRGFGVSACATCDGFFYKDKKVVVIGGGNTAVEEALFLTNFASSVTIVHRRDSFRADQVTQEKLFAHPKIKVVWDSVVDEILGQEAPLSVTGIRLKNVKTEALSTLDVDGVFIAIGHTPMSEIFKGQVHTDEEGYILAKPGSTITNIPGVFVAGDVQDKVFRQAVTAAGQGCMAALEAERFLSHM